MKFTFTLLATAIALAGAAANDVRAFGAKGDGLAKDTAAIQSAIDAAAKDGGVVELPAGTYLSGTIYLKSGVELRLAANATLKGSPDRADYCAADAFPQNAASQADNTSGGHLVVAIGCTNVTVRGPGRIDGNSAAFLVDPKTGRQYPGGKKKIPWRPAQMVFFVDCRNVTLDGVEMADSPYWTCFILNCSDVTVKGCRVHTERRRFRTWNGDGIDIDRCANVRVTDCDIDTFDDSVTLRASCARRLAAPQDCSGVTVTGCRLSSSCNAVRVGVGEGVVRDCALSGLEIRNTRKAICLVSSYSAGSRGTDIRNVSFADSTVDCDTFVDIGYRHATETEIRDITFTNIRGRAKGRNMVREERGRKFGRITFENCAVEGSEQPGDGGRAKER